jgi:hypothetical protein
VRICWRCTFPRCKDAQLACANTGIAEADIYLIDNSNPEAKRFSDQKALYMLMRKLFARADGFLSSV